MRNRFDAVAMWMGRTILVMAGAFLLGACIGLLILLGEVGYNLSVTL